MIVHDYEGEEQEESERRCDQFCIKTGAYAQGYESVMEIFHSLCGNPGHKEEFCYEDIVIKTRCNL